MGKFTDTQYKKTVDKLVDSAKNILKNPYYFFSDQKSTKVTYYHINKEKSTLDESSSLHNATIGKSSAFRYNKINDFFLFGIERINLNVSIGEVGTEADPIEGEAIILPKTIIPVTGDLFTISYIEEPIIFRVTSVNFDTLDNGANLYKIEYKIFDNRQSIIDDLERQVIESYEFIVNNVGSDFNAIIKSSSYKLIENLESLLENLCNYYKDMFFKDSLQTFVYTYNGLKFHDPYMIEFCIRNKVFSLGKEYTFVTQQVALPTTFNIDYVKSIFYAIEEKDINKVGNKIFSGMTRIEDVTSLFYYKSEDYYLVDYNKRLLPTSMVQIFDTELIENIKNHQYFDESDDRFIYNLLISYMNDDEEYIKTNVLACIHKFDITDNKDSFYGLIFSMYIIEKFIQSLLS